MPFNKEKAFKKNINHISDEQALEMVDDFMKQEKDLDIRKILGNETKLKMKKAKEIKLLRIRTRKNYNKMVKLKNQIIIDKGKIIKTLEDIKDNNINIS